MKIVSGTFKGTGAAVTVGIGFVPDEIRVFNLESTVEIEAHWTRDMRAAEQIAGSVLSDELRRYTVGAGIQPYSGGDLALAGNTSRLMPFADVYSGATRDLRKAGSLGTITDWTLGHSGNKTGNVNKGVNTTYVGEGSEISVWVPGTGVGRLYSSIITAMSNDGDAANELTLRDAVPTGKVHFIGPMYDYIAANAGQVIPAGFIVDSTAISENDKRLAFYAISYL